MTARSPDRWYGQDRLGGLRRFAAAITILNVLGHTLLGFEQSYAQPLVGLAAAYGTEIALELADAWSKGRKPRFSERGASLVDFLLSAHITGLAVSMLLYANQRLAPVAFGAALAIASKSLIRLRIDGADRHVFNPSNLGIAVTLLLFPSIGIAPPYMFTENLGHLGDWLLPALVVVLGSLLNARYTRRWPLIAAWLGGFVLQALLRHTFFGARLEGAFMPMTGVAFLLFTFYMVTDPATTPSRPREQIAFGLAVALAYGTLMRLHIVFDLFFALALVSCGRYLLLLARTFTRRAVQVRTDVGAGALAIAFPSNESERERERKVEV
ncbi:MAG: RnfABCDGE type electron transport complex subunit D [Planctomycetota bacterium]